MTTLLRPILVLLATASAAAVASAHPGDHGERHPPGPRDWHELWRTWGLEPGVLIPLALTAALYARGVARLWRGGHVGRGVRRREVACFGAGWLALVVALVSP